MQFLTSLFGGGSGDSMIGVVFALGIVMVLIVLTVWALKFVFQASGNIGHGRLRRLTVVDAVQIDARRKVIIVRRDNVEHLILTGGPQDVVLESGIPADKPLVRDPVPAAAAQHPAPAPHREAAEAPTPPVAARVSRTAVDRLRDFARPLGQRPISLRHTGLMRPTSRMEVIPGYLDDAGRDSARTTPLVEAKIGDAGFSRDGSKDGGA